MDLSLSNWLSKWLKPKGSCALVGLDLGDDSIKVVEINSTTKPYQLERFIVSPFNNGAIVKGEIKDISRVSQAIEEAFSKANIQNKNIAFSIPRSSTVIKNVKIDTRLTSSEIESRAWIEANNHFPDLVGEIYLDFSIEKSAQDNADQELMLVACRKDQLKPYLEVFNDSHLVPRVIDLNSFALERALAIITDGMTELNTIAMLNMDMSLTTLLVSHNHQLIYSHDHNYDATRLVSQTKDYATNTQKIATLNDAEYNELLKNTLGAHLRHAMHFFYSSRPDISIQKLILSGECAMTPCLGEFIQQEIGVETVLADASPYMTISPAIDKAILQKHMPALMLAMGLALSKC